jgi:hypothetical protein
LGSSRPRTGAEETPKYKEQREKGKGKRKKNGKNTKKIKREPRKVNEKEGVQASAVAASYPSLSLSPLFAPAAFYRWSQMSILPVESNVDRSMTQNSHA